MDRLAETIVGYPVPLMTRERFGELSGLDDGVLRGMIDKGYLPTIKVGRYRLINLVLLWERCALARSAN